MITIKNLSHDFVIGKKGRQTIIPVLRDISLTVEKGEIVTTVGRSGSGKSTLLNLVSGFIHPKEGEIWISGEKVSDLNETKFADIPLILPIICIVICYGVTIISGFRPAQRATKVDVLKAMRREV